MDELNRRTVTSIKGFAILIIVCHNFFHLIFAKSKENEIDFDPQRFQYFLSDFIFQPSEWVQALFTYFGHFGVQLFIFLSAYALTLSYPNVTNPAKFVLSRIKKLWPMFLFSFLLFCLIKGHNGELTGPYYQFKNTVKDFVLLLTGVYTLLPGSNFPMVGPWWFIAFIMQFYALWALTSRFYRSVSKLTLLFIILAGVIINYTLTPFILEQYNVNLLLTPLGHIPEIFSGIYYAKYGVRKSRGLFTLGLIGLIASSMLYSFWPLHHLSALVVFLAISISLLKLQNSLLQKSIYWLGVYSLPLFLVNGFLRSPFKEWAIASKQWYFDFVYFAIFIIISCVLAYLLHKAVMLYDYFADAILKVRKGSLIN